MRLVFAVLSSGLVLSYAAAAKPAALILEAHGATLFRSGVETPLDALPGAVLWPGDRLRTQPGGEVVFAYCPSPAIDVLSAGQTLAIDDTEPPAAPILVRSTPNRFCDFPAFDEHPKPPLSPRRAPRPLAASDPEVAAIQSSLTGYAAEPELLRRIAFALALERARLRENAIAELDLIRAQWPAATWTDPVAERLADEADAAAGMPRATTSSRHTFAVVIGISRYMKETGVPWLHYADKDAETFADYLQSARGGSLRVCPDTASTDCEILLLVNQAATLARVKYALEEFTRAHATPENTLILFVAAHGADPAMEKDWQSNKVIRKDPVILTHDSSYNDAKVTGYLMDDFRLRIAERGLLYRKVLVFADMCRAGNIGPIAGTAEHQEAVEQVFRFQKGSVGIFLASQAKDDAYEDEAFGGGHGAFTYYAVSGLSRTVPSARPMTFDNLMTFIKTGVDELVGDLQTPIGRAVDEKMIVVEDTALAAIQLKPASPISGRKSLRRPRGLRASAPRISSDAPPPEDCDSFCAALRAGRLRADEPDSAWTQLDRLRASSATPAEVLEAQSARLRFALEDRGQKVMLHYLEGDQIQMEPAEFRDCALDFEAAHRLAGKSPFDESRALFCQGRALIAPRAPEAQLNQAIALLEQSIRIDPQRGYAYNALGIAYLELAATDARFYALAAAALHDAIRFAPYWPYPWHNLALVATEQGRYQDAESDYLRAVPLAPHRSYVAYNLGLLYQRLNRLHDAEQWYAAALKTARDARAEGITLHPDGTKPEEAEAKNALGVLAAQQGHARRAEKFYRDALNDHPGSLAARHNLALTLSRRGASEEALRLWRLNLEQDPANMASRLALARYWSHGGKPDEAARQYRQLIDFYPDMDVARRELAALWQSGSNK